MHVSQGFCSDVSCARAFSLQPNDTRNDGCAVLVSSPDLRMSNAKEGREDCHGGVCSEKSLKFKRIKKKPQTNRGITITRNEIHERSWGDKQEVLISNLTAISRTCGFCPEGMQRKDGQINSSSYRKEDHPSVSTQFLPPSLSLSLAHFLSSSLSQSPCCDGWGYSAEDGSGVQALSPFFHAPLALLLTLKSSERSSRWAGSICEEDATEEEEQGSNRVVNSAHREWGEPSFIFLHSTFQKGWWPLFALLFCSSP